MSLKGDDAEAALDRMASTRPSLKQLFYPSLVSEVVGPYMLSRRRHYSDAQWIQLVHGMHTSNTVYVGNLSFYTREEQVHELFARAGPVKRVIMGLNSNTRTPCGFCFVEFETHRGAATAAQVLNGLKLDDRILKADLDAAFEETRQYGRGRAGGQITDDHRADFDLARGGWGTLQQARQERQQQAERMRAAQTDTFGGGDDADGGHDGPNRQPGDPELDPETYGSDDHQHAGGGSIFNIDRPLKLSASTLAAIMPGHFPHYDLPLSERVRQALRLHVEEKNPNAAAALATIGDASTAISGATTAAVAAGPSSSAAAGVIAPGKRPHEDAAAATPPPAASTLATTAPATASPASPSSKRPRHTAPSSPQPLPSGSLSPQPIAAAAAVAAAPSSNRSPRPAPVDTMAASASSTTRDDHHGMSDRDDDDGGDLTPQALDDDEDDDGDGDRTPQHLSDDDRTPPPSDHEMADTDRREEGEEDDRTPQHLSPQVTEGAPTGATAHVGMVDDDATPPPEDAQHGFHTSASDPHPTVDPNQPDFAAFER